MITQNLQQQFEYDHLFKITLAGNRGVGKTSTIFQFADEEFPGIVQASIGIDFKVKIIIVENKVIKLSIWDIRGNEIFSHTKPFYIRAKGILLLYSITDRHSFESLDIWLQDISNKSQEKNVAIFIIGNKTDLEQERQVTTEEGQKYADKNHSFFFEMSVKTRENLQNVFQTMATQLLLNEENKNQNNTIQLNNSQNQLYNIKC